MRKNLLGSLIGFALLFGPLLAAADAYPLPTKDLYFGMQGEKEVTYLQVLLTVDGVYTGPVTGNFGSLTKAGVIAFQRKYGFSPVPGTGYVGPYTRAKLSALYGGPVAAPISAPVSQPVSNESLAIAQASGGESFGSNFLLSVEDSDGIAEFKITKGNGDVVFTGTSGCAKRIASGPVMVPAYNFPLSGYIIDCKDRTIKNPVTVKRPVAETASVSSTPVSYYTSANAADCGSTTSTKSASFPSCFSDKFRACSPAKYVYELSIVNQPVHAAYTIVGPKDGMCAINFSYVSFPDPSYLGKSMVCVYDNTKSADEALLGLNDYAKCSGPLRDHIFSQAYAAPAGACQLSLEKTQASAAAGGSLVYLKANGYKGSAAQVTWKSLDEKIAKLSQSAGDIIAVSILAKGSTNVLVTDDFVGQGCIATAKISGL